MESVMLYGFVGLSVFFAKLLGGKLQPFLKLLFFSAAGAAAGAGAGAIAGFPMPAAPLPGWLGGIIGLFAGAVIFVIDRYDWIGRPMLAYLTTIIPAALLMILLYGITYGYMLVFSIPVHVRITGLQMWTLFAAAGFAMVLGFTFPERWFRRRGLFSEDDAAS
ncbi:hypothetical protein JXO52_05000 [bacterium]|nr:hypothetical protein [bacterium]